MYNDIEELVKEIELFKKNTKDSDQLCNILFETAEQLKKLNTVFNDKYQEFLLELSLYKEKMDMQGKQIISQHKEVIGNEKEDADKRYYEFISELEKSLDVVKQQQDVFEKKSVEMLDRLNALDINAILKKINSLNSKITFIIGSVVLIIILNIISIYLR